MKVGLGTYLKTMALLAVFSFFWKIILDVQETLTFHNNSKLLYWAYYSLGTVLNVLHTLNDLIITTVL